MKKFFCFVLTIIFLPFYICSYAFSNALKIKVCEDMETIKEFCEFWKN